MDRASEKQRLNLGTKIGRHCAEAGCRLDLRLLRRIYGPGVRVPGVGTVRLDSDVRIGSGALI